MNLEQAINHLEEELKNKQDWSCVACKEEHEQLLGWLKELQAIKNSNPSEALNQIDFMILDCITTPLQQEALKTVKQALLKAQEQDFNYKQIVLPFFNELIKILGTKDTDEMLDKIKKQEKVLSIIKKKKVNIFLLNQSDTVIKYNAFVKIESVKGFKELTEEEFNLLKEWLR